MVVGGFFEAYELPDGTLDRTYTAQQFANYFANFISDGVFVNPANQLKVVADTGKMGVIVRPGNGYHSGYWLTNDEDLSLEIASAAGNVSRYDAIVMQFDYDTRTSRIAVKQGAFNAKPVKPAMERNENVYELCLAYVLIGPAVLELTDAVITDTRPDNSLCGFVTGLVDQIETTELFKQYNSEFYNFYYRETDNFDTWTTNKKQDYNNFVTTQKKEFVDFVDDTTGEYDAYTNQRKWMFQEWFANLQNQLTGDVAANLQKQIDSIAERQKYLDVKYIAETKTLYFPIGEVVVIDKTLFL